MKQRYVSGKWRQNPLQYYRHSRLDICAFGITKFSVLSLITINKNSKIQKRQEKDGRQPKEEEDGLVSLFWNVCGAELIDDEEERRYDYEEMVTSLNQELQLSKKNKQCEEVEISNRE